MNRIFALGLIIFSSQSILGDDIEAKEETEKSYSEINGQLIPVGEKNRYENSYKRWNIWTNPFGYFFGSFEVGASYALDSHFKLNVAPTFIHSFYSKPKIIGGGGTLSGSIFFKKVYDGLYLEPGALLLYLSQASIPAKTGHPQPGRLTSWISGPQLIAGWNWIWDSGFTLNTGLGLGYYWDSASRTFEDSDGYDGVNLIGNLQFGYSF